MNRVNLIAILARHMPRLDNELPAPTPRHASSDSVDSSTRLGCLITTCAELESWLREAVPWLLKDACRLSSTVYHEIVRSLKDPRGSTVAIIPEDNHEHARLMVNSFFAKSGEKECRTVRVRVLFDPSRVFVLIGDYK